jgi:hypothetical protein
MRRDGLSGSTLRLSAKASTGHRDLERVDQRRAETPPAMFGRHGESQLWDVVGHVAIAAVGAHKEAAPGGASRPLVGLSDDADVARATEPCT